MVDYSDPATAELLPVCELDPSDSKYWEYKMSPDGKVLCKYYPSAGTFFSLETKRIYASNGRPDFDGSAMAKKMHQDKRDAVIDALAERAMEKGIGGTPADMIKEIIKRQTDVALGEGRDATNAAKFVLSVYDSAGGQEQQEKATVSIELNQSAVQSLLEKMFPQEE